MHILIAIALLLLFSIQAHAAEPEDDTNESKYLKLTQPKYALPLTLGAGLLTWGAYELGDNASEGRRNMAVLWGAAAATTGGILFYKKSQDEKRAVSVGTGSVQSAPALVLSYRY